MVSGLGAGLEARKSAQDTATTASSRGIPGRAEDLSHAVISPDPKPEP